MRFALGLALLAFVFIGLAWTWWRMFGRAQQSVRVARSARQVMIDVALAEPGGGGVEDIRRGV